MKHELKVWLCLLEYKFFWLPNLIFKRWFFVNYGQKGEDTLMTRIAIRCAQGYYGAGRYWEEFKPWRTAR